MSRPFSVEACDFSGWATRNDLKCSDGRVIRRDAFKHNDGIKVPLVWNHQHNSPRDVLGHAWLENREEGVYTYGFLNETSDGEIAKVLIKHGDICALSIYANQLQQSGSDVLHGSICEVSLVHKGANPGAFIDSMLKHGEMSDDEAIIYTGLPLCLSHSADDKQEDEKKEDKEETKSEEKKDDDSEKETIADVIATMTEKQQNAMYYMVTEALKGESDDNSEEESENKSESNKEDNNTMKHNVFDNDQQNEKNVLSHAAQGEILALAKSPNVGSLQTAMKIYADEHELKHGDISGFLQSGTGNVSTMFPEYVEAHPSRTPELITNDMGWVDAIMAKAQKIPHGRVRTSHVDIRNIDALQAKGYTKGNQKKLTGNYALVRRTTDPQTVYVTSELHRDDVTDIEDFDYVQFQYSIDQISLKETLAVATMLGDDRQDSDPEKIFPDKIRPIWTDDELYTIHKDVDFAAMAKELQGSETEQHFGESFIYAEAMVTALRKARKDFRGTGKPDLFITTDMHNTMILARDRNGRRIYETDTELAAALGVANIYEVTQFEGKIRTDSESKKHKLLAICVNMADYGYGASKGGDITHFTDFDIKFNQLQSLLETRKSGQLTRIKSAIVIEELQAE
jgi:hypothetical protein